jgi:sulfatase maturation enzyme AslB (radical SAM superfamily)
LGHPPAAVSEPAATCRAPFVSLRLEPTGVVQACCVNDAYPLGSITEASLAAIWRGEKADRLRQAMLDEDYSLGCQGCGDPIALGLRSQTLAVDYDHYPQPDDLGWPRHLEFALSNTCNLQCVQCSGELSSSIRAQREHRPPLVSPYGDEFFTELLDFLPHLEAATFIGGEPFLMREARRVWDLLLAMDRPPEVWVTTNGTIWNDRVEHYLHGLRMGVSLSVDGVRPETIEAIRVGADGRELLTNRDRFLAATRSYGRELRLNYCVMPQNWSEYLPFLLEAEALGVPVYAAKVQRPPEHSLYHLPADELRRVLDGLGEQGEAHADELTRNRAVWEGTLADLRAHLATLDAAAESVVAIAARGSGEQDFDERFAALRQGFQAGHDQPPVHLEIRGGHVVEVDCPGWASFLGIRDWVGLAEGEMFAAVEQRLGIELELVPVPGEDDVHGVTYLVAHDGTELELHSVALDDGRGRTHVLVGVVP